ncbi:MAG: hypothetical protein MZV70_15015 [Desulfobacterales bacterium]|nr:hypothetical protein [Desulfobacterales bacterium]
MRNFAFNVENVQKNVRPDCCVPDTGRYLNPKAKERVRMGLCIACVKACTQKAKVVKVNPIVKLVMKKILGQASRERKEPLIRTAERGRSEGLKHLLGGINHSD